MLEACTRFVRQIKSEEKLVYAIPCFAGILWIKDSTNLAGRMFFQAHVSAFRSVCNQVSNATTYVLHI